jgi:hypothetical protein
MDRFRDRVKIRDRAIKNKRLLVVDGDAMFNRLVIILNPNPNPISPPTPLSTFIESNPYPESIYR